MATRIARSLTLKWMVFSILLATIPLAITGFSIIQIYQENLKKSIIEDEKEKAQMVAERTQAFFERALSNLRLLSKDENFVKGGLSGVKSHFENVLYINDYLVELTLLDKKGQETVKLSKYEVFHPSDLKNQSKSKMFEVASKGQTYYGEFHLTTDSVPTLVIAVPIEGSGRGPSAVLGAKVHLRYLWDLLPQTQIGEEGSTYVVNQEGDLIAHPDTRRVLLGLNVKDRPVVKEAVYRRQGYFEFEHPGGRRDLVVYKSLRELGWSVIVQVPVKEAYKPLRQVAHTALKWILVALAIAIILSFFLTKKLTLPIRRLTKEMGEVANGNLNTHIEPTSKDEIGLLTESFNHMVQDLKQSHESLKNAENKYRRIFEDSKDTVFVTSVDGEIIDVNQAGADLFGYGSRGEVIGLNIRKMYVYPEDRRKFRQEVERKGFVRDYEIKLRKKDGTEMDCLMAATVRRADDEKTVGYRGIIRDVTEYKQAEERYRTVLRTAMDGFWIADAEGRFLDVNDAYCRLIGYSRDELLTMRIPDVEALETPEETAQHTHRIMESGGDRFETRHKCKDGRMIDVEVSVDYTEAFGGRLFVFLRDITERKRAEDALRRSEETMKRVAQENAVIAEIGRIINSTLNIEEVYEHFAQEVRNLISFDRISINTINPDRTRGIVAYAVGVDLKDKRPGDIFPLKDSLTEEVVRTQSGLLVQIEDIEELKTQYPGLLTAFQAGFRSMMSIPISSKDKVIGSLQIRSLKPNAYTETDMALAERVSNQIAGAIANTQLLAEIKQAEELLKKEREIFFTTLRSALLPMFLSILLQGLCHVFTPFRRIVKFKRHILITP